MRGVVDYEPIKQQTKDLPEHLRSKLLRLRSESKSRLIALETQYRRKVAYELKEGEARISAIAAKEFSRMGRENWRYSLMRRFGRDKFVVHEATREIHSVGKAVGSLISQGFIASYRRSFIESAWRLWHLTPKGISIIHSGNAAMREAGTRSKIDAMSSRAPVGIRFDMPDLRAIVQLSNEEFSGAMFSDRLGLITDSMAHNIQQELTRSMMNGDTWAQVARRIRSEMGTVGRSAMHRADMIARTELARAVELGSAEFSRENQDIIDKKIWLADPGSCPICIGLNGTEVDVDDPETLPPSASHPNCRCDTQDVPIDLDSQLDEMVASKEARSNISYADFVSSLRSNGVGGTED